MRNTALIMALCVLAWTGLASAQETAKRQLIVPLSEGGFVAFKSETSWTDANKASTELQRGASVLSSRAVMDDRHIIHRVLEDNAGEFIFGYDLLVSANPAAKQFKIEVRPLDPQFESKLRAEKTNGAESARAAIAATFPKSAAPQMLDDGDAFSLDFAGRWECNRRRQVGKWLRRSAVVVLCSGPGALYLFTGAPSRLRVSEGGPHRRQPDRIHFGWRALRVAVEFTDSSGRRHLESMGAARSQVRADLWI